MITTLSIAVSIALAAQEPGISLRYDLKPGDHLVYRESLEREAAGGGTEFGTLAQWDSHVLVAGEEGGSFPVGFQRNRTRAELLRYVEAGKDRLARERPGFLERLQHRGGRFSEANRLNSRGWPELPWSILREWTSEILMGVHELEGLPEHPVRENDAWSAASMLGLTYRFAGREKMENRQCLRIEAESGAARLRYWFAPADGVLVRLEYEAAYPAVVGQYREKATMQLVERRRGESLAAWLGEPGLQQGALAALLVSGSLPLESAALYPLLDTDEAPVLRQVLTLGYRRRLPPPPPEKLAALAGNPDPRVRTLAVRMLEGAPTASVRPIIRRALADEDYSVRSAALSWMRDLLPSPRAAALKTPADAPAQWDALGEPAAGSVGQPPLSALIRSFDNGEMRSDWNCGSADNWSGEAMLERSFAPQPLGTYGRAMTTAAFRGIPYVVHVPEDYRGDEAFPLLIYLSGGPGRAMAGALASREAIQQSGYLVVFPQANELWWHERPTAQVATLLEEVLGAFHVDTNRVFMAGFSNGATGLVKHATLWPHRLAAAVSLMGAGIYASGGNPPLPANLSHVPLLFLHGSDDSVISPQASRNTYQALRAAAPSAVAEIRILRNRDHDLLPGADDGLTFKFLQQHVRDPFPRKVKLQIRDHLFPRRYWIEVLSKNGGVAEVEAEIRDDNTIRLQCRGVRSLRLLLRRELIPRPGPVRIRINGKEVFSGPLPEDCELLQRSWREAQDPFLAYSAALAFDVER